VILKSLKEKQHQQPITTMKHPSLFRSANSRSSGKFLRQTALGAIALGGALAVQPVSARPHDGHDSHPANNQIGAVFVIAMENHNFTQPADQTSPQPIFGNAAAPFINSLITPGNPNAAQVSYAKNYLNAGTHVHPSEPSYVWAEAGSDFGAHTDAEPDFANGNAFYDNSPSLVSQLNAYGTVAPVWHFNFTPHLSGQLSDAGIAWKNYQEDVELSASPRKNAYGTNGPVNPYNGSTQYNYAAKHNPMAFFAETAFENVYPLARLFDDLANNTTGRYNWITPDQYNDAHTALNGGFTYNGIHYTGDSANIAQGDNFLAQVIPQIMASPAYQNNGVIIIWWDESEGGDGTDRTVPEIVISPLAKGNAYASTVAMSHSSDVKTIEELCGLPFINNPIPDYETNNFGGYENVATANDLSDLFVPGAIPPAPGLSVTTMNFQSAGHRHRVVQEVQIRNNSNTPVSAPLWLALDNLNPDATLLNAETTTGVLAPLGSPCVKVSLGRDNVLRPYETKTVKLEFANPNDAAIHYDARLLNVTPAP
jgi:hypothetical protein